MELLHRSNTNRTKIHLYIISNTPTRRQRLESQITKIHSNVELLHVPTRAGNTSGIEPMRYTLAELWILSQMQHLIITSKSTFGMVAQGLGRQGAWIVRQGAPQETPSSKSDLCEWEPSSEPEYQMWGSLSPDETCAREGTLIPSVGERTIV